MFCSNNVETFSSRFVTLRRLFCRLSQSGHTRMDLPLPHGSAWIPSTLLISNEKNRTSTGKCSHIKHPYESTLSRWNGGLKESPMFLNFKESTQTF